MKAIALISGGLDSTLAVKVMQGMGVELVCLNTLSPFCLCNHRSSQGCFHGASSVAAGLGLKLISINVSDEFIEIVKKPKHGYGSHMNPCIDCRILLFKKARAFMQQEGASFAITGEVLGQRPMSQKLDTMRLIEKEAGLEGLVLRPLSAKVLQETIPEKEGWVKRDALLAISGRGRREQFELARRLGVNDYPCPAGGCLLTDPQFSRRVKDLISHGEFDIGNIRLLKVGRYFRLSDGAKLVVGRNEKEDNEILGLLKEGDYLFMPPFDVAGPNCLGRGEFTPELITLAAGICLRYCDANNEPEKEVICKKFKDGEERIIAAEHLDEERLKALRI